MAATKYQLLYRYINEATNSVITNDMEHEYEEVCEFYVYPDHKIFFDDETIKAEATNEQQELISFGNSADNPKTNMLFAFNGTKKIKHKKWVPAQTGYALRDYKLVKRTDIGNAGDFSKPFTTINAATPEDGGLVVCTQTVMEKYMPASVIVAEQGRFTDAQMQSMITNSTIFALEKDWKSHLKPSATVKIYSRYDTAGVTYYIGPILMNGVQLGSHSGYQYNSSSTVSYNCNTDSTNLYSKAVVTRTDLTQIEYPGHYEEVNDSPYLIKDTYKRIQLSPWFVSGTYGSLEAALTKAKTLGDMLGLDNVKLIKLVPFDQFIKIK